MKYGTPCDADSGWNQPVRLDGRVPVAAGDTTGIDRPQDRCWEQDGETNRHGLGRCGPPSVTARRLADRSSRVRGSHVPTELFATFRIVGSLAPRLFASTPWTFIPTTDVTQHPANSNWRPDSTDLLFHTMHGRLDTVTRPTRTDVRCKLRSTNSTAVRKQTLNSGRHRGRWGASLPLSLEVHSVETRRTWPRKIFYHAPILQPRSN